jgi:hypothetical protein
MTTQVLKVDTSGRPIEFIPWQDYVRLWYQGKAHVIAAEPGEYWCSPSTKVPKAVIIQIESFVRLKPMRDNYIIKRVLFARDGWKCAYCSVDINLKTGTKDHVKPYWLFKKEGRNRSEANTWENVVTSCGPCNHKKGSKTCAEAKMYPKVTPKKPVYVQTTFDRVHHPIQKEYVEMYFKLDKEACEAIEIVKHD